MLLRIEQQTECSYPTSSKKQLELFICYCILLSFLRCASCLFVNPFLVFFFFFLLAVCTVQPHFAAPLQPATPVSEPESRNICYATVPSSNELRTKLFTKRRIKKYISLSRQHITKGEVDQKKHDDLMEVKRVNLKYQKLFFLFLNGVTHRLYKN